MALPSLELRSTDGTTVVLDQLGTDRNVVYFYPLTGRPGVDLPRGWDSIPGATNPRAGPLSHAGAGA